MGNLEERYSLKLCKYVVMATCLHFPGVLEQNFWHLLYLKQKDTPTRSLQDIPLSLSLSISFSLYLSISLFPPSLSFSLSCSLSFSLSLSLSLPPFLALPLLFPLLLSLPLSLSLSDSLSLSISLSFSPLSRAHAHAHTHRHRHTHARTHAPAGTHARTHAPAHMGARVQTTWRCERNNPTCFLLPMSVFSARTQKSCKKQIRRWVKTRMPPAKKFLGTMTRKPITAATYCYHHPLMSINLIVWYNIYIFIIYIYMEVTQI